MDGRLSTVEDYLAEVNKTYLRRIGRPSSRFILDWERLVPVVAFVILIVLAPGLRLGYRMATPTR